jgi:hypothetical protein
LNGIAIDLIVILNSLSIDSISIDPLSNLKELSLLDSSFSGFNLSRVFIIVSLNGIIGCETIISVFANLLIRSSMHRSK